MAGGIAVGAVAYLVYCVVAIVIVGPDAVIGGIGQAFSHVVQAFE